MYTLIALLLMLPTLPPALAQSTEPPNILFILIDDLNDWVEPLGGHPDILTPNLTRLANRGVNFTNAHAQAPACSPSRASLLSGLYPTSSSLTQLK